MAPENNNIEYKLSKQSYVAFDALTLKDFIIDRLSQDDNFTDQIYEGSNLSSIIEIIAYSYHVLLFYLNTTASESTFSQATIFDNMNKIVNLVGYKPRGAFTSTCTINAIADSNLPKDNYTLRKYSYFLVDDIQYTALQDQSFSKATDGSESLKALNDNIILYQGTVEKYPSYISTGQEFETIPVVVDNIVDEVNAKFISEGSISVYVREAADSKYYEYTETNSLYLSRNNERVYDLRLNENGNYEVKFGNDVFGRNLVQGDEVIIYYLMSDNVAGAISPNAISTNGIFIYNTPLFNDIYNDIRRENEATLLDSSNASFIRFNNPSTSTNITAGEDVSDIRKNTPRFVSSNLRLVTPADYTFFLERELNAFTSSIYTATNAEYLDEYIDYFYKISVDPNKVNKVLLNQVSFADSCDFNNVNVFCVPAFDEVLNSAGPKYLANSLKNLVVDSTRNSKMLSHEVVPRDPIYSGFGIGVTNMAPSTKTLLYCKLIIVRERNNKIQQATITKQVESIIRDFFKASNNSLGQSIKLTNLVSDIIGVEGIKRIYTKNIQEDIEFDGISFISWNPQYPDDDVVQVNQNIKLPFFRFPYLDCPDKLINSIEVVDE